MGRESCFTEQAINIARLTARLFLTHSRGKPSAYRSEHFSLVYAFEIGLLGKASNVLMLRSRGLPQGCGTAAK